MSLLPWSGRSDTTLNVVGCAIAHCTQGSSAAAYHVRLPGASGSSLTVLLEKLLQSNKFQSDVFTKRRMTVDDMSKGLAVAVHCMVSSQGLVLMACTRPEYPTRVVFPTSGAETRSATLLTKLADLADNDDMLGKDTFMAAGRGAPGTVRRVQLSERVTMALERVCADFEDPAGHDAVARVQAEVDEVHGVMQGTINEMLTKQEQLTALQGKTDAIAGQSRGFYRDAKGARRDIQCGEYRCKLILAVVVGLLFFFLFGGWIWGDDEKHGGRNGYTLHIPPSPPPPSTE